MIPGDSGHFRGKNVLLLQGPVGPFFRCYARVLRAGGARSVHKINFNGGDWLFFATGSVNYRGRLQDWPAFFQQELIAHRIDAVVLFGDCRPYHMAVRSVALAHAVEVWVLEEGYVRPNFVTMEREGTNGFSGLPKDPDFYRSLAPSSASAERQVAQVFLYQALWGGLYFLAGSLGRWMFPHYCHHRSLSVGEAWPWLRAGWRRMRYALRERGLLEQLTERTHRRFFLVSLQTATDAQIRVHSRFGSIAEFIDEVIESFARCARNDVVLVFKHHPLDRGHHDYGELIARLSTQHGIRARVCYIHDQHLPTLLDHAAGLVVVNSTVGLSGIHHGLPVKVLGSAIYDFKGLTFQGGLDEFWRSAATFRPDMGLYARFRSWVIAQTQLCGSFYAGDVTLPGGESAAQATLRAVAPVHAPAASAKRPDVQSHDTNELVHAAHHLPWAEGRAQPRHSAARDDERAAAESAEALTPLPQRYGNGR
jgi:capsular polysaccharide export protein